LDNEIISMSCSEENENRLFFQLIGCVVVGRERVAGMREIAVQGEGNPGWLAAEGGQRMAREAGGNR